MHPMHPVLPVKIAGLGSYLPDHIVSSAELEAQLSIPAGWVERRTGVRERRYVDSETAVEMAAIASQRALEQANIAVSELDAIIGASAAPQQAIPCTAALVQGALRAPEGMSACFDINATCLSFAVALHTAAHLVAAGAYQRVLIFSSEMATHSRNPREWESAVLFGDAAAAAVITRAAPGETSAIWHARFATYSSGADHTRILGGGTLHHPNDPTTTTEMNMFHMDGPAVFKKAVRWVKPFLDDFFCHMELDRSEVDVVVPHQASRHSIEQLSARLGFRPEQLFINLAERGNCIAASLPLALAYSVDAGRIRRGDRVLVVGTGAGLTLGALLLTF